MLNYHQQHLHANFRLVNIVFKDVKNHRNILFTNHYLHYSHSILTLYMIIIFLFIANTFLCKTEINLLRYALKQKYLCNNLYEFLIFHRTICLIGEVWVFLKI